MDGKVRRGMVGRVWARLDSAWQACLGRQGKTRWDMSRLGCVRFGMSRQARLGRDTQGVARCGKVRHGRRGEAWRGEARRVMAGGVRNVWSRLGDAWFGMAGMVGRGVASLG